MHADKHYFLCKMVFDKLLADAPEADRKKGFFGGYNDKNLKTWDEIIRTYEKDFAYLGESAQILGDSVSYDMYVPNPTPLYHSIEQFLHTPRSTNRYSPCFPVLSFKRRWHEQEKYFQSWSPI